MKLSLVTFAAAATLATVADAATCDLTKITPLLGNSDVGTCAKDSGFSFTSLAAPTANMLPKICASTACKNVVAAVKALNLGDCTLVGLQLQRDLLTPIDNACSSSSTSGSTSDSSSGSIGSSSMPGIIGGNSTSGSNSTSMVPSTSTSPAPSSTDSASSSSTVTPAPSKNPTPTPASGASSAALATGAVVVAIAAAIF